MTIDQDDIEGTSSPGEGLIDYHRWWIVGAIVSFVLSHIINEGMYLGAALGSTLAALVIALVLTGTVTGVRRIILRRPLPARKWMVPFIVFLGLVWMVVLIGYFLGSG